MTSKVYEVVATRSRDWWTIEVVSGLPKSVLGVSQARRLNKVPKIARRLISELLDTDVADIEVEVRVSMPDELESAVDKARRAASAEAEAHTAAAKARRDAAAALLNANMTMREAGQVLGVSHQRIKQLADQARGVTST